MLDPSTPFSTPESLQASSRGLSEEGCPALSVLLSYHFPLPTILAPFRLPCQKAYSTFSQAVLGGKTLRRVEGRQGWKGRKSKQNDLTALPSFTALCGRCVSDERLPFFVSELPVCSSTVAARALQTLLLALRLNK